ncbi:MAG: choice-of-anchor tandem repeat NxxGxxAF-containing protein [Verrucomicrobiota bacterium]
MSRKKIQLKVSSFAWRAAVAGGAILIAMAVARGQVTIETVVLSGDVAPEAGGGVFEGFSDARINAAGDVVFAGRLASGTGGVGTGNDQGIWRVLAGQAMEKVARTGDVVSPFDTWGNRNEVPLDPGEEPARYRSLGAPALGPMGNVAFASELVINNDTVYEWQDEAVWVTGDGTITRPGEGTHVECWMAARSGIGAYFTFDGSGNQTTTEDGEGFGHRRFDAPVIGHDGTVLMPGIIDDWRPEGYVWRRGMWRYERPAPGGSFDPATDMSFPRFVVVQGVPVPGGGGELFEEIGGADEDLGLEVFFGAGVEDGAGGLDDLTRDGLWRMAGGSIVAAARGGDAAPGVSAGEYYRFGRPSLNSAGSRGYWASLVSGVSASVEPGSREGIWLERNGVVEPLATEGMLAPGGGGAVFESFYDPVLNEEGVAAFLGYLLDGPGGVGESDRKGIWMGGLAGSLREVCRSGDAPPGLGTARFRSFSSPRLNRIGQVVFAGTLMRGEGGVTAGNDFGCWAMAVDGSLMAVLREGDVINVAPSDTRTVRSVRLASLSDGGVLLLEVGFGDGSSGLIRASLPAVSLMDYDQWAIDHIPNPALRDRLLDADGDGLLNFFEFAFGMDPMNGAATGKTPSVALVSVPSGGGMADLLSITFERRMDGSGVQYQAQVSDNLVDWTNTDDVVDVVLLGSGMQEVTVRAGMETAGARNCFIRVVPLEP